MNTCTCGTLSQAHKTDCPMSSQTRYASHTLFPNVSSGESRADDKCDDSMLPKVNEHCAGSTQLGKRDRLATDETPSVKKSKPDFPSFKVGDHVCTPASWTNTTSLIMWYKWLTCSSCIAVREFSREAFAAVFSAVIGPFLWRISEQLPDSRLVRCG